VISFPDSAGTAGVSAGAVEPSRFSCPEVKSPSAVETSVFDRKRFVWIEPDCARDELEGFSRVAIIRRMPSLGASVVNNPRFDWGSTNSRELIARDEETQPASAKTIIPPTATTQLSRSNPAGPRPVSGRIGFAFSKAWNFIEWEGKGIAERGRLFSNLHINSALQREAGFWTASKRLILKGSLWINAAAVIARPLAIVILFQQTNRRAYRSRMRIISENKRRNAGLHALRRVETESGYDRLISMPYGLAAGFVSLGAPGEPGFKGLPAGFSV
jgi:hypothetical protein